MNSNRLDPRFRRRLLGGLAALILLPFASALAFDPAKEPAAPGASEQEAQLLTNIHQLTFAGKRAGEGYFSADGKYMIFQSERDPANPFYEIYAMDLATGDEWRVGPDVGKSTCSWILPGDQKVIFSSTQADPEAKAKEQAELKKRESGEQKKYSWDYDENYDIYSADLKGGNLVNLTHTRGYDAEGSASPDGKLIVFASNREAYAAPLSPEDQARLEKDPSYFMDIYVMGADGSNVRRLTNAKGYDGGPFFSPDGQRIVWRRFSEDGATAEIHTMKVDGSDEKVITHLGAMSWAPYYYPSGDYIIFATSVQGFGNFELYMVDAEGKHDPVRVTYTDGFDGLPVFSPDGKMLAWASGRDPKGEAQIFIADWNDAKARELLGLPAKPESNPAPAADPDTIKPEDVQRHIDKLASDEFEGRLTGTEGEKLATDYAAEELTAIGLEPAGDNGSYIQPFTFTAGVSMGEENEFVLVPPSGEEQFLPTGHDWRPLAFSKQGAVDAKGVVFAGYGILAPAHEGQEEYDSYAHLDVKGKWVVIFRFLPEGVSPERRQFLNQSASLRHKVMVARDKGAAGVIVVSGPNSQVKQQLVPLKFDASLAGSSVAAVSMTDDAAAQILKPSGKDLKSLQDALDKGDPVMGFEIPGVKIRSNISVVQEKRTGHNVLARLKADNVAPDTPVVLVGAHIDHLGRGTSSQSLAQGEEEEGEIHHGADDNASGSAAVIEIARYLAKQKAEGKLPLKHDIEFALWSGEELGLLGSSHFVQALAGEGDEKDKLPEKVCAYYNMDMIGRMRGKVMLHGIGSSSVWPADVERANEPVGLPVVLQDDPYIPTDSTSFYVRGVPFVNAFTGIHADYHKPSDTADKINSEGEAKIALLMARLAEESAERGPAPDYHPMEQPKGEGTGVLRAYLGTVPDYSQTDAPGVKLSGVAGGGPADKAGLRSGDSIVELAGKKIENIYDYTYAIQGLKIGEPVKTKVLRGNQTLELTITPGSRE